MSGRVLGDRKRVKEALFRLASFKTHWSFFQQIFLQCLLCAQYPWGCIRDEKKRVSWRSTGQATKGSELPGAKSVVLFLSRVCVRITWVHPRIIENLCARGPGICISLKTMSSVILRGGRGWEHCHGWVRVPGVPPSQAAGVTSAVASNLMGFPTGAAAFPESLLWGPSVLWGGTHFCILRISSMPIQDWSFLIQEEGSHGSLAQGLGWAGASVFWAPTELQDLGISSNWYLYRHRNRSKNRLLNQRNVALKSSSTHTYWLCELFQISHLFWGSVSHSAWRGGSYLPSRVVWKMRGNKISKAQNSCLAI